MQSWMPDDELPQRDRTGKIKKSLDKDARARGYVTLLREIRKKWRKRLQGKTASMREVVEWVFNHADFTLPEIDESCNPPSAGALRLLVWVRKDDKNYASFLRDFASTMVPKEPPEDRRAKFADDGRETFPLLEMLRKEIQK